MIQEIYIHLKNKNLNPYFPGQHKGECESPFLIIKEGSQIPSINSRAIGQKVIDIILFVPVSSYVEMKNYSSDARTALKELSCLRKTGAETPIIADDEKKAYTMSIEYVLQKKLEG